MLVDNYRLVTPLEQVSKQFVAPVIALCVRALEPLHSGDKIPLRGLDQQMIMVPHQHISVYAPAGSLASFAQRLQDRIDGFRASRGSLREPEERKSGQQTFYLTKPRHKFKDAQHRNRYWKNNPRKLRA
jgi:hypothetical protein